MSRRTRSVLPVQSALLQPRIMKEVIAKKQAKETRVKLHYDLSARDLPSITQGQTVRALIHHNSQEKNWVLGICIDQLSDRPYIVLVNGKKYRRNRRDIRPVQEQLRTTSSDHQSTIDDASWNTDDVAGAPANTIQPQADDIPLPTNPTPQHTRTRQTIQRPARYSKRGVVDVLNCEIPNHK